LLPIKTPKSFAEKNAVFMHQKNKKTKRKLVFASGADKFSSRQEKEVFVIPCVTENT